MLSIISIILILGVFHKIINPPPCLYVGVTCYNILLPKRLFIAKYAIKRRSPFLWEEGTFSTTGKCVKLILDLFLSTSVFISLLLVILLQQLLLLLQSLPRLLLKQFSLFQVSTSYSHFRIVVIFC